MNKIISFLFVFILSTYAMAQTEIDGIYYNLNETDRTAEVTSYDIIYSGSIIIPSIVTYDNINYNVNSIDDFAFMQCFELTAISLPNSITTIGEAAFKGCI